MNSLPPFLMTSEIGSFARKTIEERKPAIIDKILSHYDYTPEIRKGLLAFKAELNSGPVQLLQEETDDSPIWKEDLTPWMGRSWLELPWFLAETYFSRKILEVVRYFQPGPWMEKDPYQRLKDQEMSEGLLTFSNSHNALPEKTNLRSFQDICYKALWSNRGDLSNLTAFDENMGRQSDKIILDDSGEAFSFVSQGPLKIAYVFDNVGKELFFDLALIDYLLECNLAGSITCFLKNQPFFVSDAMLKDMWKTIDLLAASSCEKCRSLGRRIIDAHLSGRLRIETPPFFVLGRMFRRLPETLKAHIAAHDLVILKGDVNYRRLMGDRHWLPTTPVVEAAGYFPTSFLSFRTLKAEIAVGLSEKTLKYLENEAEQDWRINGKRGMITFLER